MLQIEEIAKRFAEFVNRFDPKTPVITEEVTIRDLAEMCWVLGITPLVQIVPMENGEADGRLS